MRLAKRGIVMNSRKPKQNLEQEIEFPSKRLQLALAVPDRKPTTHSNRSLQHAKVEIKVELAAPQARSRLH